MARILLGVTGSVAAIKTLELFTALQQSGHEVKVVATQPALYFFEKQQLPEDALITDDHEWPKRQAGYLWQRNDPVLHIELRRWADVMLIAPLDANTLAKLAVGICDNCLTCVWRAWDLSKPVLLAPAMNTLMWDHPLTTQHLHSVACLFGLKPTIGLTVSQLLAWIKTQPKCSLHWVGPIEKSLACGDIGIGAMDEVTTIVSALESSLSGKR